MNDILKYFDKQTLSNLLFSFTECTKLPIRLIDLNGEILLANMGETTFCQTIETLDTDFQKCLNLRKSFCAKSRKISSSFLIDCLCGLNCHVIPININSSVITIALIGPFMFHKPSPYQTLQMSETSNLSTKEAFRLHESVHTIPVIPETLLPSIDTLTLALFRVTTKSSMLPIEHMIDTCIAYPREKETLLIREIKEGNLLNASAVLNDLLGYVLFTKDGSVHTAKIRAIELCCVLSRVTIESGATQNGVLNFNNECISSIQNITNIYDLSEHLQEITEVFISSIKQQRKKTENKIISQATEYISLYFNNQLTLETVAKYVYLNPSYFSTLFKQHTGTTYSQYLNMIRIEHSKTLLSDINNSLVEIALKVGFQDYNYFTKVFKKTVGLTPSQYRGQVVF